MFEISTPPPPLCYIITYCPLSKASVLASSSEKDGGDVINDFDIEEEEILIENRLESVGN